MADNINDIDSLNKQINFYINHFSKIGYTKSDVIMPIITYINETLLAPRPIRLYDTHMRMIKYIINNTYADQTYNKNKHINPYHLIYSFVSYYNITCIKYQIKKSRKYNCILDYSEIYSLYDLVNTEINDDITKITKLLFQLGGCSSHTHKNSLSTGYNLYI